LQSFTFCGFRAEEANFPALAVQIPSQGATHIDNAQPTLVVSDIQDVILDPYVVCTCLR
jgi:hypothetical protein